MKILRMMVMILVFSFLFLSYRSAWSFHGYIETSALSSPNQEDTDEWRNRLLLKKRKDVNDRLTCYMSGRMDVLVSDREEENNDIMLRVDDAYGKLYVKRGEVTMGYSKVFWGKLDHLSPVDIVNPLDVSQLFLRTERKEAKLAVPLVMASAYLGEMSRLDVMVLPVFKQGTYDELNEISSPFNIAYVPSPFDTLPVEEQLPSKTIGNMEYSGRFSSVFREIDWSLYYFHGFGDFPLYTLTYHYDPLIHESIPDSIKAEYVTYSMFGYDFEFVWGKWGIRGEGALFTDQGFQKKGTLDYIEGDSIALGFGADRSFGDTYLNVSALYQKIFTDDDIEARRDEITLLGNLERSFSYETKMLKLFSIFNTMSHSIFLKGTCSVNLIENLWADVSIGLFDGKEKDTLGRFKDSDFFAITCTYHF
jgi:hypothetical protein